MNWLWYLCNNQQKWVQKVKGQYMNRSTFWMIKYMNGSIFSKARYMNGVGFEIRARTPVPKLPQLPFPPTPPTPRGHYREKKRLIRLYSKSVFQCTCPAFQQVHMSSSLVDWLQSPLTNIFSSPGAVLQVSLCHGLLSVIDLSICPSIRRPSFAFHNFDISPEL